MYCASFCPWYPVGKSAFLSCGISLRTCERGCRAVKSTGSESDRSPHSGLGTSGGRVALGKSPQSLRFLLCVTRVIAVSLLDCEDQMGRLCRAVGTALGTERTTPPGCCCLWGPCSCLLVSYLPSKEDMGGHLNCKNMELFLFLFCFSSQCGVRYNKTDTRLCGICLKFTS